MKNIVLGISLFIGLTSCAQSPKETRSKKYEVAKSTEQWKSELSDLEYRVLREKATEPSWSGPLNYEKRTGLYMCAGCGDTLFTSNQKFESGSGWPSFYDRYGNKKVITEKDYSHGWVRDEILCGTCGGHLGHVFDDGPKPTGKRYCVNSASLKFIEKP